MSLRRVCAADGGVKPGVGRRLIPSGGTNPVGIELDHPMTSSKKLLVTKGIATRSMDATSSSWPYY